MKYYNCIDSKKIENKKLENIIIKNNLQRFFNLNDNKYSANYVGFIIKKDFILTIYPKKFIKIEKFKYEGLLGEEFELLSKIVIEFNSKLGLVQSSGMDNNFPIKAYLDICNYYLKYGLYLKIDSKKKCGYGGKIDWQSTLNESNKIITKNYNKYNLMFDKFIIKTNDYKSVYLTECMMDILEDGYNIFGKYFNVGIKYKKTLRFNDEKKYYLVIKKLRIIKKYYFKDHEKQLIDNLIEYFEWKNKFDDRGILLTNTFNLYWEIMVENYLNKNLLSISKEIQLREDNNYFKFKKEIRDIKSNSTNQKEKIYRLEFDHFYMDESNIYILDSKYYKKNNGLDYKQMIYDLYLREQYPEKNIINGLIIPTSGNTHSKIHFKTEKESKYLGKIEIQEYYINLKDVMKKYIIR